jgi:hypothetical protein
MAKKKKKKKSSWQYYLQNLASLRKKRKKDREYSKTKKKKKATRDRGRARTKAEKLGIVKKGDGKHVHHKDFNTSNNSARNLAAMSASKNSGLKKSFSRKKN